MPFKELLNPEDWVRIAEKDLTRIKAKILISQLRKELT